MRRLMMCGAGLLALIGLAVPAAAQTTVAVIDVQRVVTDSDPGKEALQRLRTLQDEKIEEGRNLQTELEALRDQLNKQRFTLSEQKLEEMTGQVEDKTIALQRFEDDAKRSLEEARRTALGRLEERIMPIINEVGKERGLTLIFNKFQSGLVYADEAIDITDDVIRRFNTAE
ncbi:MAG TPA: OmpH family outer membrane protein [Thermoanaerobaculales bacterium]|nr:OmpH family outer membrane protein [Thermoanaerobaculales bacterium]HQL29180.1 OmpH family outer membrane protein [Thermoanaerobaculales bacterium]HQN95596.1 OmpH family outer membrane protein [Thermoanaerobaculales bacterium]